MRTEPLGYFRTLPQRYGGLVRMRLGPIRYFSVSDPALIQRVLVEDARGYRKGISLERARVVLGDGLLTSEGELHRRQARLIAPAFSRRRIGVYQHAMRALAEETSASWRDGGEVDVAVEMTRLTLRVVVTTLFDAGFKQDDADRVGDALTDVLEHFEWLVLHPLGLLREKIPTPRVRRFRAARGVIDSVVADLITTSRADRPAGDDLLAVLLAARDDDGGMSRSVLRDEVMTLLIAGHETTTNWLTFTWLALAENPDVEARLHAELDQQLAHEPVSVADAEQLPYLHAVLEESLRLYPPVWGIGRRALSDRDLAGYRVPAGSVMSICQFAMHRDPRFWRDPERFDPDRWLGERASSVPRGAFFPFADGPRRCIAEHFARAEAMIVIATIAQRWRLRRSSDAPVVLDAKVTLRPRGGVRMTTRARSSSMR